MKNLSNNFLIPMPHVNDPIFKKSLIYICSHDKDGAMGLIINKSISDSGRESALSFIGAILKATCILFDLASSIAC